MTIYFNRNVCISYEAQKSVKKIPVIFGTLIAASIYKHT